MLRRLDEPLGIGHQPENPAGRVADAGHFAGRAVGVRRPPGRVVGIPQHQLTGRVEGVEGLFVAGCEPALGMRYRQFEPVESLEKHAASSLRLKLHPAVDEPAAGVVGQRCPGPAGSIGPQQQARLQQHLKAVADAENQSTAIVVWELKMEKP